MLFLQQLADGIFASIMLLHVLLQISITLRYNQLCMNNVKGLLWLRLYLDQSQLIAMNYNQLCVNNVKGSSCLMVKS